jgi:hypothetical protein
VYCAGLPNGMCAGYAQWYPERWGCEAAPSGYCPEDFYERAVLWPCYWDPLYGCHLIVGTEIVCYMKACD